MTVSADVLHAFRWNAAGRIIAQLGNWLITIFVIRLLTPTDYGLMGLAAVLMGLCVLVNDIGAVPALIQRPTINTELTRKIFAFVLLTNVILYLIAFVGAPHFAGFFGEPRLTAIVRVFTVMLLVEAAAAIPSALLRRDLKFKQISLIDFAATMIGSLTVLALAAAGYGVWSLVFGALIKSVCNSLGLLGVTGFHQLPLFRFSGLTEVFSFGSKVSGAGIIWYFNRNVNSFLIGKILGDHALGLFSVANNLALMPATKVTQLSQQIAFAAYSRIQHDRATVLKYFFESMRLGTFFFFPVCWGMSAVAPELVDVVLGLKWHAAIPVVQIVALGVPYRALLIMTEPLVNGIGKPEVSLKNTLTITAICPGAMIIGVHWGLVGLCVFSLGGLLAAGAINLRRSLAVVDASCVQLFFVCLPSFTAATVMYAAVLAARTSIFGGLAPVWRLIALVILGVLVYGIMTLSFNRQTAMRSLQLLRGTI